MKNKKNIFLVLFISVSLLFTNFNTKTLLAVDYRKAEQQVQSKFISKENSNDEGKKNIPELAAVEPLPTCLENGGFEEPDIRAITGNPNSKSYQVNKDLVPYWGTTAAGNKIELFRENTGIYISGTKLTPREGEQAAELNADENSTLYQNIATNAGKTYEWGLSHRGRDGTDTMALVIGPRQSVEPKCRTKSENDQFMKMGNWVKAQVDVDIGLNIEGREIGCSKKIILYSKPFEGVGTFVGGDTDAFSWTKDENHTQTWNMWLMSSNKSQWEDYGSKTANPDYDFTYEVPEESPESIFAFSAIQTAKGNNTVGNFIDNIEFKEYYNVEVYTTPGGTGTYIYNGNEIDVDFYNNYTGKALKEDDFFVVAHELTGTDYRKFIGANINGEFVDVMWFWNDGAGNYTYGVYGADRHYKIRLIFSSGYVIYDINVGKYYVPYDDYHYDGTPATNYEVPLDWFHFTSYTSHATKKYNDDGTVNDGWRFVGWKYENEANDFTFDGVHTVNYIAADDPSNDTLTILGNVVGGGQGEIRDIPAANGATLVAGWKYRQAFIPRLFNNNNRTYENSGECGSVAILNVVSEDYQDVGKSYFGSNNELITAEAYPNEGYEFRGWYDESGNYLSPNVSYSYQISDGMVTTAYAHYVKIHNLTVADEVNGNMGDRDKYFNTTIYLSNMEKSRTYSLTYSNNGTQLNPKTFKSDAYGNSIIQCKLKHGGCINLTGLLKGSTYRIIEDNYTADGYTTTGTVPVATALMADETVTVVNTKNVTIPSGVDNDNKPYLYMTAVSFACLIIIIIFYIKKHKK